MIYSSGYQDFITFGIESDEDTPYVNYYDDDLSASGYTWENYYNIHGDDDLEAIYVDDDNQRYTYGSINGEEDVYEQYDDKYAQFYPDRVYNDNNYQLLPDLIDIAINEEENKDLEQNIPLEPPDKTYSSTLPRSYLRKVAALTSTNYSANDINSTTTIDSNNYSDNSTVISGDGDKTSDSPSVNPTMHPSPAPTASSSHAPTLPPTSMPSNSLASSTNGASSNNKQSGKSSVAAVFAFVGLATVFVGLAALGVTVYKVNRKRSASRVNINRNSKVYLF